LLEYITYTGPKKYGCVDVKGRVPKAFKRFYYKRGERYYVGFDIPASLADWLAKYCSKMFSKSVDDNPGRYLKERVFMAVEEYMALTGEGAYDTLAHVVQGLIEMGSEVNDAEVIGGFRDMIMEVFRESYKAGSELEV